MVTKVSPPFGRFAFLPCSPDVRLSPPIGKGGPTEGSFQVNGFFLEDDQSGRFTFFALALLGRGRVAHATLRLKSCGLFRAVRQGRLVR